LHASDLDPVKKRKRRKGEKKVGARKGKPDV